MKIDFEKVLADYGLKVGDTIIINYEGESGDFKFIVEREEDGRKEFYLYNVIDDYNDPEGGCEAQLDDLLYYEWEKVEPKKKFGDLYCCDVDCDKCKLFCLNCLKCNPSKILTIREIFQDTLKHYPELEPMREYFEKELDKEWLENE